MQNKIVLVEMVFCDWGWGGVSENNILVVIYSFAPWLSFMVFVFDYLIPACKESHVQ